jgi:hypothetical protein
MIQTKEFYDYTVYSDGRVWSNKNSGKWINGGINKRGYEFVILRINNQYVKWYLHRLILQTFNEIPEWKTLQVNHKNLIKSDNRLENLEWISGLDNIRHAIENDAYPIRKGENAVNVKLTDEEAKIIKYSSFSANELKRMYGCSRCTVSQIRNNRKWKHI